MLSMRDPETTNLYFAILFSLRNVRWTREYGLTGHRLAGNVPVLEIVLSY
jgi:hypothetical protein